MTFVELTDDVLRIDTVNPPTRQHEPLHVHPKQESGTEVVSGSLVFEIGGERRRIAAGESVSIPPDTPHRFYNDGDTDAHHIQFFRPRSTSRPCSRPRSPSSSRARSARTACRRRCSSRSWSPSSATSCGPSGRRGPFSARLNLP